MDIIRLPPDDWYGYNRYLDDLHYKAPEIYLLKMEAEESKRKRKDTFAKKFILEGLDNNR